MPKSCTTSVSSQQPFHVADTAAVANDQSHGNLNKHVDSEDDDRTLAEIEPIAICELVKDAPDPRLVEVVRVLARRAARQWFEETETQS